VVDPELCIGCGICETKCPVVDKPAIYVTSAGESRNPENRIFLG
jgi:ferredoxin